MPQTNLNIATLDEDFSCKECQNNFLQKEEEQSEPAWTENSGALREPLAEQYQPGPHPSGSILPSQSETEVQCKNAAPKP